MVDAVNALESSMAALSDADLRSKTDELRARAVSGNAELDDLLPEAFAVVREASKRVLGLRPFDVQLIGGAVLHSGQVAEMRTGEGKTLVAVLPAYLNALTGKGVHVVTVNDYLARRDSEWVGQVHKFLGLTVGLVQAGLDEKERKEAYNCDITYVTNSELGFDYLRDNLASAADDLVLRKSGFNFCVIDEVDSILIDEARTPLIISGQGETSTHLYGEVTKVIPYLRRDEHYVVDEKAHSVSLTDEGIDEAQRRLKVKNLYDPAHIEELHILQQCLRASTLYKRDVNYMVSDAGEVLIIDEFTGRVLSGRRWSDGLHQAVEAKEHVRVREENRTMATITFQNLFRLYKKLSGMTGTAETEAEELHKIYKLEVLQIPTNRNIQRKDYDDLVYKTEREKFKAVVEEIADSVERGQPSLVGTVSVEKSEAIASLLRKRGIKHEVLNAKQHEREAFIVAQAGRKGSVTVATNMAGRGTDIILGGNAEMLAKAEMILARKDPTSEEHLGELDVLIAQYKERCEKEREEVVGAGGLHIIGTERHESRRIDNQLRGRAGRQGDPGSSRFYLSLEDDLMRIFAGERVQSIMDRLGMEEDVPIEHPWVTRSVENAQKKVEARNFDQRKNVLEYDDVMNQQRKAVYKLRKEVLLGMYTREVHAEDSDAAPTVAAREWDEGTMKRLGEVLDAMMRHFPVPSGARQPSTLDEMEGFDPERLGMEVYHYFGARVDLAKLAGDPKAAHKKLLEEVARSMQMQRERVLDLADEVIARDIEKHAPEKATSREEWNLEAIGSLFFERFGEKAQDLDAVHGGREEIARALYTQAEKIFDAREGDAEPELMLRAFKSLMLEEVDRAWMDHLTNMEHLRDGIGLRSFGQRDPKLEYKKEGFDMFTAMMQSVNAGVLTKLFHIQVRKEEELAQMEVQEARRYEERQRRMVASHAGDSGVDEGSEADLVSALASLGLDPSKVQAVRARAPKSRSTGASVAPTPRAPTAEDALAADSASVVEESAPSTEGLQAVRTRAPKIGRNDNCPCGSGKKYKDCHGAPGTTPNDSTPA